MDPRGERLGPVRTASGVRNIGVYVSLVGEVKKGWWYHGLLGEDDFFEGAEPVWKTLTVPPTEGNLPLLDDGMTPKEMFPKCIKLYPLSGNVYNAVALSCFGLEFYLERRFWDEAPRYSLLSLMAVGQTPQERLEQIEEAARLILHYGIPPEMGIQLNVSCPNVDHGETFDVVGETLCAVDALARLNRWLDIKFGPLDEMRNIVGISHHPRCHGVTRSNSLKFGKLSHLVNHRRIVGSAESPLKDMGGGSLTGHSLYPLTLQGIDEALDYGLKKPYGAGGGIDSPKRAREVIERGRGLVRWVEMASVVMVRPWMFRPTVKAAHHAFNHLR